MSTVDRAIWIKRPDFGPGPKGTGWHPVNSPYINSGGSVSYDGHVPTISTNGSIEFSGGYLTAPHGSIMLGTDDFCIETWYWLKQTTNVGQTLFSNLDSYIQSEDFFEIALNRSSALQKVSVVTGNGGVFNSYSNIQYETWTHLAVIRYNGIITMYINGIAETATLQNSKDISGDSIIRIGQSQANLNGSQFLGNVCNYRVTVGTPVYTGPFTVPAMPLKTVQPNAYNVIALDGSKTRLLLNSHTADTWLTDSSAFKVPITTHETAFGSVNFTYNNKPTTTDTMPVGNASMSFNGATAYLTTPYSADFATGLNPDDFTIEFYFNPLGFQADAGVIDFTDGQALAGGWRIKWSLATAKLMFEGRSGTHAVAQLTTQTTFNMNTWKHVALVRQGGTLYWYVNGALDSSTASNTAYGFAPTTDTVMYIGTDRTKTKFTQMYMTSLRIVRKAVYTGPFTLPRYVLSTVQSADTNISALTGTETVLLLSIYSKYKFREDSSISHKAVTNHGGTYSPLLKGFYHQNGKWEKFFPSSGFYLADQSGSFTFTVPPGIYNLTVDIGGAGGGGGGGEEVGVGSAGGGGGGGGYQLNQSFPVVPLEVLTIQVGKGGDGAPYVGRTTNAPAGAGGGTTSLSGIKGALIATGGDGGAGGASSDSGGGGGGKIICTKLYELGLMSEEIYLADQAFGAQLVQIRPDIYNGYRAWAEIVVDWMSGSGPKMMPWMSDEEFSVAAKKWSISWAQDIATPWAEEMAFKMGKKSEGSLTGRMITAAGIPICKAVGVWQRIFGPSKKPAGFIKGLSLIGIFIMFKGVAELGRLIEGKKETKCIA